MRRRPISGFGQCSIVFAPSVRYQDASTAFRRYQTQAARSSLKPLTNLDRELISQNLRSRSLPYIWDHLTRQKSKLLFAALSGFLPDFLRPHKVRGRNLPWWPGHHLVYFSPAVNQTDLLPDGTDSLHAPNEEWTQRLWAGGRVRFPKPHTLTLDEDVHALLEIITDVKFVGLPGREKIFVNIRRAVASAFQSKKPLKFFSRHNKAHMLGTPLVIEDRELCFLREEPGDALKSLMKPRAAIPPPLEADWSHTLVPTPALLFRFSALTFNAHAIHLDPEYTRQVYGLPNLVVHGPLLLVLMLECMRRAIEIWEIDSGERPHIILNIEYKNLMPLFVNEEMTVRCKRTGTVRNETTDWDMKTVDQWSVWIEKDHGDQRTVAVRGTVTVGPLQTTKLVAASSTAKQPDEDAVAACGAIQNSQKDPIFKHSDLLSKPSMSAAAADQQHGQYIVDNILARKEDLKNRVKRPSLKKDSAQDAPSHDAAVSDLSKPLEGSES